jgi:hypothetical protein
MIEITSISGNSSAPRLNPYACGAGCCWTMAITA